ncbi:MAG TPA: FAD-dependent oxidoreductase, partial [Ilumatobacteraceae bacterium]|nr:FAD-dependent oxidoreductase [Ilumatobacteraceae bacterium]
EALAIDLRLGVAATGLDLGLDRSREPGEAASRRVLLGDGTAVACDAVVVATGAGLRHLPGQPDHPAITELRTLDDSLALQQRIAGGGGHVVVIGAGFIGLEVAASARALGNEVTVLEGAPAPLIRGLGAEMGQVIAAVHADHGVPVHCGVRVGDLTPRADGSVEVAVL